MTNHPAQLTAPWTITERARNSHRLTFTDVYPGWEGWALLMSDEHFDNADCDLGLLKRHHEEAWQRRAPVLKFGDLFCAMQGKWDKRADQGQLREEHRGNNYLDRLVNTAADWYAPYARDIALVTPGNHESSITQRHETDLTTRLVERLRQAAPGICQGAFAGFVEFSFRGAGDRGVAQTLCYHHGYGGGGEVTRGLIDNNRTRGQYHADIFYSGHIHRRNLDENIITHLSNGKVVQSRQLFLRGSTYKNERDGWHVAQGRSARPLGGWWLRFRARRESVRPHNLVIDVAPIPAL